MSLKTFDFVIVGAGVIGLSIGREIQRRGLGSVVVIEKEGRPGIHASGRNSGVIHAGLYYSPGSLKAKLCIEGARRLLDYAKEHEVPHLVNGKVIVAKNAEEQERMGPLFERAQQNGVEVCRVDKAQLAELEPEAWTYDWAIHSPNTGLVDPKAYMKSLADQFVAAGGEIIVDEWVRDVHLRSGEIVLKKHSVGYGYLVNAAGMYADRLAHSMGVGQRYRILPFRGLYRRVHGDVAESCKMSVYPMPDLNMPFLGVHLTPGLAGKVFSGPTAQPALGRENYDFFSGIRLSDGFNITRTLTPMLLMNRGKMRNLAFHEMRMFSKAAMAAELKKMLPRIEPGHLGEFEKVGLRAQLYDTEKNELVQDFLLEQGEKSLHVLNAVSPGLTSSLSFAEYVVDQLV